MLSHETEHTRESRENQPLTDQNITGQDDRSIVFFSEYEGALFRRRWITYTLNDTVLFPQRSFRGRYSSDFRKVSLFCKLSLYVLQFLTPEAHNYTS